MTDLTQKQNVVDLMKSSRSDSEWDKNADMVRLANNGYPAWWFDEVNNAQLYQKAKETW